MGILQIAWRSIQQRGLASFLTTLSLALGVSLVVAVLLISGFIDKYFGGETDLGFNMVVGSKGSGTQLVLNSVYHLDRTLEPLPYSFYKKFTSGEFKNAVHLCVPICMGDTYQGFRVVGTTTDFCDKMANSERQPFRMAKGRNFYANEYFEAVIGSAAARATGLTVGSTFQPVHGVDTTHVHDPFKVVGVLAPTGTPVDNALYINIEGFYLQDNHAKPEEESAMKSVSFRAKAQSETSTPTPQDATPGSLESSTKSLPESLPDASNAEQTPTQESTPANAQDAEGKEGHTHAENEAEHDHEHDEHEHDDHAHDEHVHDDHAHEHDHEEHAHEHASPAENAQTKDAEDGHGHEHGDEHEHHAPSTPSSTDSKSTSPDAEHHHEEHDHAEHDHSEHAHAEHDHESHDHESHDHAGHDHEGHSHDPLPESQREVSALLINVDPLNSPGLAKKINEGVEAQAALPILVIQELLNTFVRPLSTLLFVLAMLIVVVSAIGILVSIYNSMSERRKEIAVMRALGASREMVMAIILCESCMLALLGGICGWVLGRGLVFAAKPWVAALSGAEFGLLRYNSYELWIVPGLIGAALIAGLLPSLLAYRVDVSKSLAP